MRMRLSLAIVVMVMGLGMSRASDTFQKPTAEELSMTSLPGYPGAAAVILFREQITTDDMHVVQRYERVKILTEEGKQYANVELRSIRTSGYESEFGSNEQTVGEIEGRTIHADGKIIPFSGKPYDKVLMKTKGVAVHAKVFTLPDVEVGSIIEYRYAERFADNLVEDPQWYIQGDLFVRSAHYVWHPTSRDVVDSEERPINSIAWFPILPAGANIVHTSTPATGPMGREQQSYELKVKDIPPITEEDYMPPMRSLSYRVQFSLTAFRSGADYWKSEGKSWSKHADAFMKQSGDVKAATDAAIAGATTPDEKLRKIYAKVMTLENTDYTRERQRKEEGKVSTVSDVLSRGRGSSSQLTQLFVAMARSAGVRSYVMLLPDRSENFFISQWLNMGDQLEDEIAIVNVDGKDVYLDPGSRYCPYGHLAWQHSFNNGLRQDENGTSFGQTSGDGYAANATTRVANLKMDEHGETTGKIDLSFTGAEALRWRHVALRGDAQELKDKLREMLEARIPHSLEVKVSEITNVDEYEKPLKVSYTVNGTIGTATGKRLVLPADLFEAGSVAKFSQEKRETAVDFSYPQVVQDALRLNYAKGFETEAVPKNDKYSLEKKASYTETIESAPNYFTTRRAYLMGDFLFLKEDYPVLRTFYSQMQTKDKESVVLKVVPVTTASAEPAK